MLENFIRKTFFPMKIAFSSTSNISLPYRSFKLNLEGKISRFTPHIYTYIHNTSIVPIHMPSKSHGAVKIIYHFQFYLSIGLGVGGIRVFPDETQTESYVKPWRNVNAKVGYIYIYNIANRIRARARPVDLQYSYSNLSPSVFRRCCAFGKRKTSGCQPGSGTKEPRLPWK